MLCFPFISLPTPRGLVLVLSICCALLCHRVVAGPEKIKSVDQPKNWLPLYTMDKQEYYKLLNPTGQKKARLLSNGYLSMSDGVVSFNKDLTSTLDTVLSLIGLATAAKATTSSTSSTRQGLRGREPLCVLNLEGQRESSVDCGVVNSLRDSLERNTSLSLQLPTLTLQKPTKSSSISINANNRASFDERNHIVPVASRYYRPRPSYYPLRPRDRPGYNRHASYMNSLRYGSPYHRPPYGYRRDYRPYPYRPERRYPPPPRYPYYGPPMHHEPINEDFDDDDVADDDFDEYVDEDYGEEPVEDEIWEESD